MSSIKKLAGETVIYGIGGILPRVVNFLLVASYLTFHLEDEKYGIHAILYSYSTLALVLFTLRMETTFFRFGSDKGVDRNYIFNASLSLVLISSVILAGLMLIFNESLAAVLSRPEDYRFVIYFAIILFLDAIAAIPFGRLRLDNRPIKFTTIKVLNSVITACLIVFCFNILPNIDAWSGYYNESYVLDYVFVANIIGSAFIVLALTKELSIFRPVFDRDLIKKMMRYAWPLIIVGIAGSINQFSDRFIISYLSPGNGEEQNLKAAGLFTGAIKIAVIMNLFVTAFNYAVEPFFFKNRDATSREKIYGSIALTFTICATGIFMFVMFYLDILKFMISSDFHEALYVVPVALLANLFLGLYYNFSIWYKISNKTIYGAIIASLGSVIFLLASFYFIQKYDLIGANIASLICFVFMCALAYLLGQKHYPIHYPIGKMMLYLVVGVGIYFLVDVLNLSSMYKILIGTLALLAYLGVAYRLDVRKFI